MRIHKIGTIVISLLFLSLHTIIGINSFQDISPVSAAPVYTSRPTSHLSWHACEQGFSGSDCAVLSVPMDYRHSESGTVQIGISRMKAEDPPERIGTLFVNQGGPGASGDKGLTVVGGGYTDGLRKITDPRYEQSVRSIVNDFAELRQHFDIIGFDPRGIGRGSQIHCPEALENRNISMLPGSEASYQALASHNHTMGLLCERASGPLLQHIDTRYVADDIDSIRKALGEKTISYYGISYGSVIGQIYAQKYPDHLRAIVIDGNVNHTESGWILLEQEASSEEASLRFLDQQCRQDPTCVVPQKSIVHSFDHLLQQAEAGELLDKNGLKISARDLTRTLYDLLVIPNFGFSKVNKFFADPIQVLDGVPYSATSDYISYVSVSCQDFIVHEPSFPTYHSWIKELKNIAPYMYRYSEFLTMTSACIGWPLSPHDSPAPLHINPELPVFMVANRIDPSTPLDYSVSLHKLIPRSKLLITDAVGHTANLNSHCGRVAITHYLLDLKLPQHDEYCYG